jgi:hypothetical protein
MTRDYGSINTSQVAPGNRDWEIAIHTFYQGLPFLQQLFAERFIPAHLVSTQFLKEHLEPNNDWGQKSQWVEESPNKANDIPLGWQAG